MRRFLVFEPDEVPEGGLDVVIVTADAYVDHPSFGAALVGRYLESLGLSVGIISQPDWRSPEDFRRLGRPRLFFGVTAGNLDSMVALYTANRKPRSEDAYSPGGRPGRRPYLPTVVYTQRLKQAFPGVPVVLGGLEASLRRVAHYDHYTDTVRRSVLLDAKADLLVYGHAEAPLRELVAALRAGADFRSLPAIRGTAVPVHLAGAADGAVELPAFEEVRNDAAAFREMTRVLLAETNPWTARTLVQRDGKGSPGGVVVRPPAFPLSTDELDRVYGLPFVRRPHPSYQEEIPAWRTVRFSVTAHRGCFGGCSFCGLGLHHGKFVQSRSAASVLEEVRRLVEESASRGVVVTDIGGPTANMYGMAGRDPVRCRSCGRRSCLVPSVCPNLDVRAQRRYLDLLAEAASLPGVKAVYVNSGVRFDLALEVGGVVEGLVEGHVQGHLSTAPEHSHPEVLRLMNKPSWERFLEFRRRFLEVCRRKGREYYCVPYLIVGHPGADDATERHLAESLRKERIVVEQVQEFYPLPMTLSAMMYRCGTDLEGRPVAVERRMSRRREWKRSLTERRSRS